MAENGQRSKKVEANRLSRAELGLRLDSGAKHLPKPQSMVRIREIAKKIVAGQTRLNLLDWIEETWEVGESTAEKYYNAAIAYLTPVDEENFKEKLSAKLSARYEQLYKDAYEARQYKVAREILDSLSKLYGVSGGNKVTIAENNEGDKVIQVTFD